MKIRPIASGVILLCLAVLLTGCGKRLDVRPVTITRTVVEKVEVPSALLEPCPEPQLDAVETTGDLERVAIEGVAGTACGNADKQAIREWQEAEIQ